MLCNPAVDIGLLDLEVGVIHWMDGIFHLDNVVDVNGGWGGLGPVASDMVWILSIVIKGEM